VRTSLGEEGGEALVVVAGLALLSEVTVRLYYRQSECAQWRSLGKGTYLDTVLETVELGRQNVSKSPFRRRRRRHWPCVESLAVEAHLPARVGNLATSLADYYHRKSASTATWRMKQAKGRSGARGLESSRECRHTVQADDFTHCG